MTSQHWRAWATAQTVVCWLGLMAAIALGLLGGAAILSDLADDTDLWHGLGVVIGAAACVLALFLSALFEAVRRLTRRGVDRACRGDSYPLRTSAYVGLAGAGVSGFVTFHFLGSLGSLSVVLLAPVALFLAPPIGILLTAPRQEA